MLERYNFTTSNLTLFPDGETRSLSIDELKGVGMELSRLASKGDLQKARIWIH